MSVTHFVRQLAQRVSRAKPASYRLFDVELKARQALSPSLHRYTFGGEQLEQMSTAAADQRIKLLFPNAAGQVPALPLESNWHQANHALPDDQRHPMRTYTIRALRRAERELDVEFVLHGETGPASRWATHAQPGDRLQIVAPNAACEGGYGGYEWNPPPQASRLLLIGDETALPAIAGILEGLAGQGCQAQVEAFIEVPYQADCIPLSAPAHARLHWHPRHEHGLAHGQGMQAAARQLAHLPAHSGKSARLAEVDIERDILWELAKPSVQPFYAWVAGESAAVMAIRKHWVSERGIDRSACSFMGYWRLGRALD